MKYKIFFLILAFILLFSPILIDIQASLALYFPNKLRDSICKKVDINDSNNIDFAELTDFEWEKLLIIGPYTRTDQIDSRLGFKWYLAPITGIQSMENINLLLFVSSQRVVYWTRLPGRCGDFNNESYLKAYSPDDAIFKSTKENSAGSWSVLVPIENS